jgi:hypothetical protein
VLAITITKERGQMPWLQNLSHINGGNLNNVRCKINRTSGRKDEIYERRNY